MEPDWSRERKGRLEWAPSKSLLAALRSCHKLRGRQGPLARLRLFVSKRRVQFWCVITGADIPTTTTLGGGLMLPHPNGLVFHRDVIIGVNCMIMQQVTIGQLADGPVPRLGNGVYVGAGAKILGPVTIGDNAAIGANAVVLDDVPANATAVGIPARVVRQRDIPKEAAV
jgi:serine O-acetyltransferase